VELTNLKLDKIYHFIIVSTDDSGNTNDPVDFEFSTNSSLPTNEPPVASFTYSCVANTCNFDASGSSDSDGSIDSYDWDFGDGTTATGPTTSHTFSDGSYNVELTVADNEGATDSDTQLVIIGVAATTMHVSAIDMSHQSKGINTTITTEVTVVDENGSPVQGAMVDVSITLPDTSVDTLSAETDSNGIASFTTKYKGTGTFEVTVTNVTHDMLNYESSSNLVTTKTYIV
jgi:PKD repeat protein